MNKTKIILSIIFFLPAFVISLINSEAMVDGAYENKLAASLIFAVAGLLSSYVVWGKEFKGSGLKSILALLIIWVLGLSLPTLF